MDDATIDSITRKVLDRLNDGASLSQGNFQQGPSPSLREGDHRFDVGVSARHVHLSQEHVAVLFGKGHALSVFKMLKQPDQYAAQEKVSVVGPKRTLYGVRVLGPARKATQVELSMTDCFSLGIAPVVRDSGKLENSSGAVLVGPCGVIHLPFGVIVAARHVHVEPSRAKTLGLVDQQRVSVRVCSSSGRNLTFENVLVRCGAAHVSEFHVDTDEANAGGLRSGDVVEILG